MEYGILKVNVKVLDKNNHYITLLNVKYVPNSILNIVSKTKLEKKGALVNNKSKLISRNGKRAMLLKEIDGFLVLEDNIEN